MTNRKMFFTMLWGAVFRRRSRAMMAVIASLVGAATLFCLASVCVAVPQQMNEEMRAYGANLIVTPASATGKSQGIDTATVRNVTANAFPQIRSFARRGFRIIPTGIILVITVYPIRNSLLDTGAPIVRNVKHVIFISYTGNIRIDSRNLLIGILKKKLR